MLFCPSYHLVGASPLPLDAEYLFLVGSTIFLLIVNQWLVAVLVFLQEKMSTCLSLHSTVLPSTCVRLLVAQSV